MRTEIFKIEEEKTEKIKPQVATVNDQLTFPGVVLLLYSVICYIRKKSHLEETEERNA